MIDSFDQIAEDLQTLRLEAGDVPYAEIVRRIAKHREANGVSPAASRPARTTVYDAFRQGRSRIDPQLVGEIARALGADDHEAARWEQRCLLARRGPNHSRAVEPSPSAVPLHPEPRPPSPSFDEGERASIIAACC